MITILMSVQRKFTGSNFMLGEVNIIMNTNVKKFINQLQWIVFDLGVFRDCQKCTQ